MTILPKRAERFPERGQLARELAPARDQADKAVRAPQNSALRTPHSALAGFTMVEIAICLAVIGFALVAIIGVLPIGMSVQKENREDTIINFDANYLMDAIRSGARGLDNLTNYVVVITNITTLCNSNGVPSAKSFFSCYNQLGYTNGTIASGAVMPAVMSPGVLTLTNGTNIMLLLNWPKYVPTFDANADYWSNYISADFRSITGSPLDQGVSQASKDFAFTYRVTVEIVPSSSFPYYATGTPGFVNFAAPGQLTNAPNTNQVLNGWQYAKNLQANMYDIRLRFRWPVLPGGKLGNGDRVFRSSMSGNNGPFTATTLTALPPGAPYTGNYNPPIYFLMQPQSYSVAQ